MYGGIVGIIAKDTNRIISYKFGEIITSNKSNAQIIDKHPSKNSIIEIY